MSIHLPVFVISFNRGAFLCRTVASYRRQTVPVDIVVHDNGSDDPFTLGVLAALADEGAQIHRGPKIASADELNLVDRTIDTYFRPFAGRGRYVVTDCDIDLTPARPETLEVFGELLDRFPQAECVGPMLRIADIPESYPLFNHVMNRHIEQFWQLQPQILPTLFGECAVIEASIDTTFALHRAGSAFRRLKRGLRVYHPFEARHLDWYPEDGQSAYRQSSSPAIAHWNNAAQFAAFEGEPRRFDRYVTVETGDDGRLIARERSVAGRRIGCV